jgi:hypothetical protein
MTKHPIYLITLYAFAVIGCMVTLAHILPKVDQWLSEDARLTANANAYIEQAGEAYELGVVFGEAAAIDYGIHITDDDVEFRNVSSFDEAYRLTSEHFNNRLPETTLVEEWDEYVDFPTPEKLLEMFDVEGYNVGHIPVQAFQHGYVDGFVNHFD